MIDKTETVMLAWSLMFRAREDARDAAGLFVKADMEEGEERIENIKRSIAMCESTAKSFLFARDALVLVLKEVQNVG